MTSAIGHASESATARSNNGASKRTVNAATGTVIATVTTPAGTRIAATKPIRSRLAASRLSVTGVRQQIVHARRIALFQAKGGQANIRLIQLKRPARAHK